jgi:DNA-binding NarL/FixJ family response regulator
MISPFKAYRIMLADEQAVVRRGLRSLFDAQSGYEVCTEASGGAEAIEQAKKFKPDLLILDLALPDMNGLDAMEMIRQEAPSVQFLVLTMHLTEELARQALRIGALGYVLKSDAERDLITAVEQVRRKQPFYTARLAVALAENFAMPPAAGGNGNGHAERESPLTEREINVLQMLAEGKSNKQVAAAMNVSIRTVESHRNRIMHKMNFESFSHLVRFAVRKSLVAP